MSMRKIEQGKAQATLDEYTRQLGDEPLVITKKGKPVAVLVPVKDMDMETLSLSTNSDFLAIIERSRARHEKEGGISSEEVARRLGIPQKG
ncbi:MAG: type II toxin-antitoxin system Phd/YefM family antitoxin [Chloroflexi bacterium]|nr:type II toxin-antitoxin system Phd/YefM family antitoxin [Chloroflexota bacterium]